MEEQSRKLPPTHQPVNEHVLAEMLQNHCGIRLGGEQVKSGTMAAGTHRSSQE
jgi:hypothetical protein